MADQIQPKIGKIVVDRELCIGAATCIAVAPGVFELDGENKAIVLDPHAQDDATVRAAAEACPVLAISLFDDQGNKMFPK